MELTFKSATDKRLGRWNVAISCSFLTNHASVAMPQDSARLGGLAMPERAASPRLGDARESGWSAVGVVRVIR